MNMAQDLVIILFGIATYTKSLLSGFELVVDLQLTFFEYR